MSETVNQEATTTTAVEPERTFTQKELDSIVQERLQRERNKYADYEAYKEKAEKYDAAEEAQKSELQKANERATALEKELNALKKAGEVRDIRSRVAEKTGVPVSLLTADTEEACAEQAKGILEFRAQQSGYPTVNDAGEVTRKGTVSPQNSFSEWFRSVQK